MGIQKTVWILTNGSFNHPDAELLKRSLISEGIIARIEEMHNIVKKIKDGDVVFGFGWQSNVEDLNDSLKAAGKESVKVKTAVMVDWHTSLKGIESIEVDEDKLLSIVDLVLVRSQFEKDKILSVHTKFHPDDMYVVGGLESYFDILNVAPRTSWEVRENVIAYPYPVSNKANTELSNLMGEYRSRYPKESFTVIRMFANYNSKEEYYAALSRAKVIYGSVHDKWPDVIINATFLGVYPFVPDEGIFKEIFQDEFRTKESVDKVELMHSLLNKKEAAPIVCYVSKSMNDLLRAL